MRGRRAEECEAEARWAVYLCDPREVGSARGGGCRRIHPKGLPLYMHARGDFTHRLFVRRLKRRRSSLGRTILATTVFN